MIDPLRPVAIWDDSRSLADPRYVSFREAVAEAVRKARSRPLERQEVVNQLAMLQDRRMDGDSWTEEVEDLESSLKASLNFLDNGGKASNYDVGGWTEAE